MLYTVLFVKETNNSRYISYGNQFRKLIDIEKGYWIIRQGEISFDRFIIPDDSSDFISHGERGNFFDRYDFEKSLSGEKSYRIIIPEGSELKVYKELFKTSPKKETEMLTKLREKFMSDMNRYSEKRRMLNSISFFDDRMSKIYPKYKELNLSDKDKDFNFRIKN